MSSADKLGFCAQICLRVASLCVDWTALNRDAEAGRRSSSLILFPRTGWFQEVEGFVGGKKTFFFCRSWLRIHFCYFSFRFTLILLLFISFTCLSVCLFSHLCHVD